MKSSFADKELLIELQHKFSTPLYIYDLAVIKNQIARLRKALETLPHRIHYAVKANSNLTILKELINLDVAFDTVSEGEIRRVLQSGGKAKDIVFAGVGKKVSELEFAIAQDINLINVESVAEADVIESIASKLKREVRIALRINPNIEVNTHPYLATGINSSKFGIGVPEALDLWKKIKGSKFLKLAGLHCHIGSSIHEIAPFEAAYKETINIANSFRAEGAPIKTIDLGGGLGVAYSGHYPELELSLFGEMLKRITAGTNYTYIFEPGKFIIAEAGALLTEVLYIKTNSAKNFAIVDAGMNDLIRPALYDAYHAIDTVESRGGMKRYDIVGPVCESGCYLAKDREMPELRSGDLLVIRDAGAYGITMASNYNSRLLPEEVLLDDKGGYKLIRKRARYEDLWKDEIL